MRDLMAGMAVALAAGLMMGAAMKPDLGQDDRPGQQLFATVSADHPTGPFDDGATLASYTGKVPDYVYGTDWKRMGATQAPPIREEAYVPPDEPAPVHTAIAVHADESYAAPAVVYPSVDGGAVYPSGADVG